MDWKRLSDKQRKISSCTSGIVIASNATGEDSTFNLPLNNFSSQQEPWQFHQENPEEDEDESPISDIAMNEHDVIQEREEIDASPSCKKKRTSRGKQKIDIKFIKEKSRRFTTFSKRKTGLMKKAYELAALTNAQVLLLVASETGHVYTFATKKLQSMISSDRGKTLIQTCLSSDSNSNNCAPQKDVDIEYLTNDSSVGLVPGEKDSSKESFSERAAPYIFLKKQMVDEKDIIELQLDATEITNSVALHSGKCVINEQSSALLSSLPPHLICSSVEESAEPADTNIVIMKSNSTESIPSMQFFFVNNPQTGQVQPMYIPTSLLSQEIRAPPELVRGSNNVSLVVDHSDEST